MKFNNGKFFEYESKTDYEVVFRNKHLSTITIVFILKANKTIDFKKRPCVYVGDTYFKSHVTYSQVPLDMPFFTSINEWMRKSANKKREVKYDA